MLWTLVRDGVTSAVRAHARLLHLLLWTLAVIVTWARFPASLENFTQTAPAQKPVDLPYSFHTGKGTYVFEGTLHHSLISPRELVVRVDDCVESVSIDGKEFFKASCTQCDHCPGSRITLPNDLESGAHKITFNIQDHGGLGVFEVREASGLHWWHALLLWLFGLVLMALVWRIGMSALYAWIPLGAVVLSFIYALMTDPFTRQHDVDGHREYIEHLLNKQTMPTVKQGWETWQPPLYYALNALWVAGTRLLDDTTDIFLRVQAFSALLYVLCICIAALYWKRFGLSASTGWFGLAAFAWMPAHLFISARVNNDALTPLLGVLVTILSHEYLREGRLRTVILTSGVLLASLVTKTSSLSLVAGAGLCLMVCDHLRGRGVVDRLVRMAIMGVPAACWLGFWMWRNHEQTGDWLYVNAQLQDALKVSNSAYKYLSFDYRAFLSEKSFNTFSGTMRDSFPTSLAASMLTGEFGFEYVSPAIITFLRATYVPVLFMFMVGIFTRPRAGTLKPWLPALLVFGGHAFFMASYNWKYSYACNEDARLWGPAYFPACVLLAWGYESAMARFTGKLRVLLRVAPFAFLVMLAWFYKVILIP